MSQGELNDVMTTTVIKLDVGGKRFKTSLSTLTTGRAEGSMLAAMFSGRYVVQKDEDGYAFIDRDGELFTEVLRWLRTGAVSEELPLATRRLLAAEGDYFALDRLSKHERERDPLHVQPGALRHALERIRDTENTIVPDPAINTLVDKITAEVTGYANSGAVADRAYDWVPIEDILNRMGSLMRIGAKWTDSFTPAPTLPSSESSTPLRVVIVPHTREIDRLTDATRRALMAEMRTVCVMDGAVGGGLVSVERKVNTRRVQMLIRALENQGTPAASHILGRFIWGDLTFSCLALTFEL